MNDTKNQTKQRKQITYKNPLEAIKNIGDTAKSIGADAAKQLNRDVLRGISNAALDQIFGPSPKVSGEVRVGESVEVNHVETWEDKEHKRQAQMLHFERRLFEEERTYRESKSTELRLQLKVLIEEVQMLAQSTAEVGEEIKIAAMQAPIEPGIYHMVFFEQIVEFIQSFRKKLSDASVWLHATNKRAQKKNYWSMYKQHKGKFLLSSEHYIARSAG